MLRAGAGARLSAQSPPQIGSRRSKAVAGRRNTFPPMHFRGFSGFSTVLALADQTVKAGSPCWRAGAGARLSAQSPLELGCRRSKDVAGRLNTFPPMHFRGCSSFSTVLALADQTVKAGSPCWRAGAGARLSAQSPLELGCRRSKDVAGRLNTFPPMHFRGCSSFSTVLAVDDQTVKAGSPCSTGASGRTSQRRGPIWIRIS